MKSAKSILNAVVARLNRSTKHCFYWKVYKRAVWQQMITFLLGEGWSEQDIDTILGSTYIRHHYENGTLAEFVRFYTRKEYFGRYGMCGKQYFWLMIKFQCEREPSVRVRTPLRVRQDSEKWASSHK